MIDTDKYEQHTGERWTWMGEEVFASDDTDPHGPTIARIISFNRTDADLMADAPLILAAYDKQVRWINDILFRLEKMEEASASQRLRFLLTVQEELEMMIE